MGTKGETHQPEVLPGDGVRTLIALAQVATPESRAQYTRLLAGQGVVLADVTLATANQGVDGVLYDNYV